MKRSTSGMTVRPMAGVSAFRLAGRVAVLRRHRPSPMTVRQPAWVSGTTVKAV
ncbi:hypothetical protein D3C73_1672110 [compost metagenome]